MKSISYGVFYCSRTLIFKGRLLSGGPLLSEGLLLSGFNRKEKNNVTFGSRYFRGGGTVTFEILR